VGEVEGRAGRRAGGGDRLGRGRLGVWEEEEREVEDEQCDLFRTVGLRSSGSCETE
jgi:hypothetical protein